MSFIKASRPREVERIVGLLGQLLRLAEAGHAPLMAEGRLEHLLRRTGCLYLFESEEKFKAARQGFELRAGQRVRMEFLDAQAIREREPALTPRYARGVMFSDAYSLDTPHRYMLGLAELFQQRGGRFVQARVDDIVDDGTGLRVADSTGTLAQAQAVVIAAGAWAKRLTSRLGDEVRLNTERGYHVLFPEAGQLLNSPTCYPEFGFYMTPLSEGLRAAGTVELGGLGRPSRPVRTAVIEKVARQLVPGLGPAGRTWLGFRPSMPDSIPVIGKSPRDPRVIYAFGHGHLGITLGGITGRLVTELVSDLPTSIDISPFRPNRF